MARHRWTNADAVYCCDHYNQMVLRTFRAVAMKPIVASRLSKLPPKRRDIVPLFNTSNRFVNLSLLWLRKVSNRERRRSSTRTPSKTRTGARGSVGFLAELAEQDQAELTARSQNGWSRLLPALTNTPPRKSVTIALSPATPETV